MKAFSRKGSRVRDSNGGNRILKTLHMCAERINMKIFLPYLLMFLDKETKTGTLL